MQWKGKEHISKYSGRRTLGAPASGPVFSLSLPAPSPGSSPSGNVEFSPFFPAHCMLAADNSLWPEYLLRPARPGHVEGQEIYKPALSRHIHQQTCLSVCEPQSGRSVPKHPVLLAETMEKLMGALEIACPLLRSKGKM